MADREYLGCAFFLRQDDSVFLNGLYDYVISQYYPDDSRRMLLTSEEQTEMDQKIDAITEAFQTRQLIDRIEYIIEYYEYALPYVAAKKFADLTPDYVEMQSRTFEYM